MANVYSPQSLGIKPPQGGFQEGGWYSGRQYIGGTLSEPGEIHPSSQQVGAGKAVSTEVIAQTSPANVPYIEQQRKQAAAKPVTPAAAITPTQAVMPSAGSTSSRAAPGGSGVFGTSVQPATIDLPKMYENLYKSSGISEKEAEYSQKEREYIEAKAKLGDNPFLSEATRQGREARLETLFQERTKNLRDEIATKKADVETKLNLELKQFDINSSQAQQALTQFNTLLGLGALDGASGEDIASITRSTGISSEMIYSAINARKESQRKTQVVTSTNDAGVVTVSVVDPNTGDLIKQTSLGAIGNVQQGKQPTDTDKRIELQSQMVSALESVKNSYGHVSPADWQGAMASWIARGGKAEEFVSNFKQYTDPNRGDFDQVYFERD